jgi:hypothetical protein
MPSLSFVTSIGLPVVRSEAMPSIDRWVRAIVEGRDVPAACSQLSETGARGVAAILRARAQPWPEARDPRDLDADFTDALTAIARVDPGPVIEALARPDTPASALVWALGCAEHSGATDALIDALGHRDKGVRWAAAVGLGRTRPPQAVDALIARLRDRSSHVRYAALETLAGYADSRVAPALIAYRARYEPLLPGEKRTIEEALARSGRGDR